ncbi:TonB family protein [Mucilaginibacter sp.]|uniref:energy transducer TonB n=1 Tax=Mucilaginibacter sp. TaxID=1882438 RepID=UPI0032674F55
MLNTKFDLYKTEWLDLVFDDRNKAYGAYDLRAHYAGTLNKAMAIAFTVIITGAVALSFAFKTESLMSDTGTMVNITPPVIQAIKPPEKQIEKAKPVQPVKATPPVAATKFTSFVVTSKPITEEPPVIEDIHGDVGPVTTKGPEGPSLAVDDKGPVGPVAAPAGNGEEIIPFGGGLEVNPEPYGGMAAFGKFLGKALRFPPQALDANVSGRVVMTFVVEKNGELTDITVIKGAGYGFDQEATRVLKLAKAWKPGIQNGQPVRVRYTIPINFQLPAE